MNNRCSAITTESRRCRLTCIGSLQTCHVHTPECSICLEKNGKESHAVTTCGHVFHKKCISTWYNTDRRCPMCRNYNKPTQIRVFYEQGASRVDHARMRPILIHLVENELLHTDQIGILNTGEVIQRNGDIIGFIPRRV